MTATAALYEITVKRADEDTTLESGTVLYVEWLGWAVTEDDTDAANACGNPTGKELLQAAFYVKGVLARLTVALRESRNNRDNYIRHEVATYGLVEPDAVAPCVEITLARKDAKAMGERIEQWLKAITTVIPASFADAWLNESITAETIARDEAAWREEDARTHEAHRAWLTTTLEGRAYLTSPNSYTAEPAKGPFNPLVAAGIAPPPVKRTWRRTDGKTCHPCTEAEFSRPGSTALGTET
jgi:hypothetical protein